MAVNPEIKKLTEKIRYTGPADQVRESIAGGMDLTSEEASATRKIADQTENRQTKVESDFKTLQQEYTENGNGSQTTAEISLARDGELVLADRLNRDFGNITAQFQQTNQEKASTSYVNQLVASLSDNGPYDAVTTVTALYEKYPNGAPGPILVFADNHSYIWSDGVWKDFGVYQGIEVKDNTIGRVKMTEEMTSEFNEYVESVLSKNFTLRNRHFYNGQNTIVDYLKRNGAIKELTLIGFDSSKPHRLRLLSRNNSSFKYRFIISTLHEDGTRWMDVFDTGSDFSVVENLSGLTNVSSSIGNKTVKMVIDYNIFPPGLAANDGQLGLDEGRYLISNNCFYQNKVEKINVEIQSMQQLIDRIDVHEKNLIATRVNDIYKLKYRYGEQTNMVIEFDELGPNKNIQPRRFYKETSEYLTNDFSTPDLWHTLGTDWVSPYGGVTALTGTTTSFTGTVGGNHGTPNGHPTGEPISCEMYIDGKLVQNGEVLYCEKAQVIVKNYVSASNKINPETGAKARSFIETITYTVTSGNMEVSVYLEALEDIRFEGYVGLQLTTNMFSGFVHFNDGPNKYGLDGVKRDSLPLPWKGDRMVYSGAKDVFIAYTNREVGLGDLSFKASQPVMYLATNNKMYAHLLGTSVTVNQGDSIYYNGGYTMIEPMESEGAESAYFIKLNGETIYCVDFLKTVERTYFKLPKITTGKQIEIIEKSDSISADMIISSNGLRLNVNDYGTIKFKIVGY